MKKARRTAAMAIALIAVGVATAAPADAATVGPGYNGSYASLHPGDSLTINLTPANSGSTGYHWQVARKPSKRVLRLSANHRSGKRQVFKYKALAPGATSLKLQYRPPGTGKAAKTFRLTVLVNEKEPSLDCAAIGHRTGYAYVARSGTAVVFKINRTLFLWQGAPARVDYDEYYGCELSQDRAYPLGALNAYANPHEFYDVTLRGTVVGYVHDADCSPFDGGGCLGIERTVESQDLHTGKLIRRVGVELDTNGSPDRVAGLVMSPAGGLAWIEQGTTPDQKPHVAVWRSDAPATTGETVAHDSTLLDSETNGPVDPDSLLYDGTNAKWRRGGTQQQAPLH